MRKLKLLIAACALMGASATTWGQASYNPEYTSGVEVTAGGNYFLYNIGAKMFLTDGMDWGTHATADHAGRLITFAGEGKYSIYTASASVNNDQEVKAGFMTTNGYCDTGTNDAQWQFETVSIDGYSNAYTIKNSDTQYLYFNSADARVNVGNSTNDNYSYWLIIPKSAREDIGDYTFYLMNTDFNRPWERAVWAGSIKTDDKFATGGLASNRCGEKFQTAIDLYQTISVTVPNGKYQVNAQAFYRQDKGDETQVAPYLYANSDKTTLKVFNADGEETAANMNGASTSFNAGKYINTVETIVSDGKLTLGINVENGNNWVIWDNFNLTYLGGIDLSELEEQLALRSQAAKEIIDGGQKMNEAIKTELQTAYSNASSVDKTQEALEAAISQLSTAIEKANSSIAVYAKTKEALDLYEGKAASFDEAGKAAFDIAEIKAAYESGTMTEDQSAAIKAAYETAVKAQVQPADNSDMTPYIVNSDFATGKTDGWTKETPLGGNCQIQGGTRMEYWAGNASNRQEASFNIYQVINSLPDGVYTVTAYMYNSLNNEGGDYTEFSPTCGVYGSATNEEVSLITEEGTECKPYTTGQVIVADGILTIGVKNTVTPMAARWFVVDKFELTYVRQLTEEEKAVKPTAISLDQTTISLNQDKNEVTLTPSFTPSNATQTVKWTSSDENVAKVVNGVVTGVAPGTATITVKSTLDESVTATCDVTASYPEFEAPQTEEVTSGPEKSVVTYGENLITNGAFSYGDGLYAWTDGQSPAKTLTAANFEIVTEEGNSFLRSKSHNGAGGAGSIGTAWPIEAGKTYVFGYRAKAVNQGTTEFHKVSLTNTLTDEQRVISTTQTVGTDWTDIKYKFTNSDGYAYLQFRARWLGQDGQLSSFDDFYLVEVSSESTTGNVQYLADNMPTANLGNGAFQYSNTSDAQALIDAGSATVEEVKSAYEKMMTLNAPSETQAYNLIFNCEGHTATGNALTLIPNPAQTQGLYGLRYQAPANVNLAQAFYFTHTTGNKYKLHAIDTDGNERYITTQAEGYGTTWYDGIRTITDAEKAMEVEIRPNGEGLYILWNTGANKAIAHNGNNNPDLFTNNTANFQFVETTKPSIEVNTTEAGWGTIIVPFDVTSIPEGVKVYSCSGVNGNELTLKEEDAIEANKPYIIEGTWSATLTGDAQGTALTYTDGALTGVYAEQDAIAGTYVMQNSSNVVGFYKVASDSKPTLSANHAYLTVSSSAREAYLLGEATAIKAIEALTSGKAEIYNAAGARQQRLQKGVNIIKSGDKTVKVMVK